VDSKELPGHLSGSGMVADGRATRIGRIARAGRRFGSANPWPDREFAKISRMWRAKDVAPDGAQCGARKGLRVGEKGLDAGATPI
jgi:hypothetical protein